MAKTLIHLTHGPEQPTRAALALHVARAASQEGHSVTIFLAGDAVQLVRGRSPECLCNSGANGLRVAYEAVVASGAKVYLSDPSARSRGLTPAPIKGGQARPATPHLLVKLAAEHDQVFSY